MGPQPHTHTHTHTLLWPLASWQIYSQRALNPWQSYRIYHWLIRHDTPAFLLLFNYCVDFIKEPIQVEVTGLMSVCFIYKRFSRCQCHLLFKMCFSENLSIYGFLSVVTGNVKRILFFFSLYLNIFSANSLLRPESRTVEEEESAARAKAICRYFPLALFSFIMPNSVYSLWTRLGFLLLNLVLVNCPISYSFTPSLCFKIGCQINLM